MMMVGSGVNGSSDCRLVESVDKSIFVVLVVLCWYSRPKMRSLTMNRKSEDGLVTSGLSRVRG